MQKAGGGGASKGGGWCVEASLGDFLFSESPRRTCSVLREPIRNRLTQGSGPLRRLMSREDGVGISVCGFSALVQEQISLSLSSTSSSTFMSSWIAMILRTRCIFGIDPGALGTH